MLLRRLSLAALVMLLLCLTGLGVLGWMLRAHFRRCERIFGDLHAEQLRWRYVLALGALFPRDGDGDGFPDAAESFLGFDPRTSSSHPDIWSILTDDRRPTVIDIDAHDGLPNLLLAPDEIGRLRMRLGVDGRPFPFAAGMRMLVRPGPRSLVCLRGSLPVKDPLLVPVATDGRMEFDLLIPKFPITTAAPTPASERDSALSEFLQTEHPLSHARGPEIYVRIGHRQRPLPCTVEELPAGDPDRRRAENRTLFYKPHPVFRLTWPTTPDADGPSYIEATRDENADPSRQQWYLISHHPPDTRTCVVMYLPDPNPAPGGRGPLRFRVVPSRIKEED